MPAAFGRLCVETTVWSMGLCMPYSQPPSGGCVLKQYGDPCWVANMVPAAFGRLCVETTFSYLKL